MATGDQLWSKGSEIILETAASSAAITNGAYYECDSDNLQPADVGGRPLGIFEFDAAGTFSAAPTAGAMIYIYEQTINSDGNDSPDVDASYPYNLIGSMPVDVADAAQYLRCVCPINESGGKYWLKWVDGGAGTAQISAGWELRVIPVTMYPSA